jgi:hypothetical protein
MRYRFTIKNISLFSFLKAFVAILGGSRIGSGQALQHRKKYHNSYTSERQRHDKNYILKGTKKKQPGRHEGIDGEIVSVRVPEDADKNSVNGTKTKIVRLIDMRRKIPLQNV